MSAPFAGRLEGIVREKGRAGEFSGVVLVRRDEEELYRAACGYAARAWQAENRPETRFRIASVGKLFTAVAVLQLVERKSLDLKTSLVECLGLEGAAVPREATVRHMLTMTSGIADWFEESGDWEAAWAALCREHPIYLFRKNEDYLPLFLDKAPLFPVGERHQYNGAGFILLGLAIEKLSGLSYFDYIRRHIFEPAGMTRSDFVALDAVEEQVAEGYIPVTDEAGRAVGWKRNIYSTTPEAAADGGATSTADDLHRFSRALREGRLLSPEWTHEMLTPKVLEHPEPVRGLSSRYGYGSFFLLDPADRIVRWGHTGEEDGVSCRFYHYPARRLDVVILGNQSGCAGSLAWQVHDLVLEMFPV